MGGRYAVLASNSFSGAHCVDRLLEDPANEVLGLSRSPEYSDLFLPYKRHAPGRFRFLQRNLVTDPGGFLRALDDFRPEYIVNFAAQGEVGTSWKYPVQWYETNAVGIVRLADALRTRSWLKRYVHISTPEVYGTCEGSVDEGTPIRPSTPYAASKAAGDLFLSTLFNQYRFPLVTIRSTNVYGKHQQLYRIIPRSAILIRKGEKIPLHGGGRARKAYLHIRDAVLGTLAALERGREGEVYHLSPDGDIAVRDLVSKVCSALGRDFAAAVEEVAERPGQDARYSISSEKARRELGWAPRTSLEEGLRETLAWIDAGWERISREPAEYIHKP